MAFSRLVIRAQIPKPCDLCETDINIKWKCIQCGHVMCDKCKNIHLRVQTSDHHDIVDIKSFTPEDVSPSKAVNTTNILCNKHPLHMSCLFCRTCDQLVCPDCVKSTHKKHDFDPINEVVNEKYDHLKDTEARMCKDLTMCKLKVKEIQATEEKCDSMIDQEISKIKQKEKELKDAISKSSLELQNILETERNAIKQVFTDTKTQVNNSEKDLVAKQSEIQGAMASNQGSQIFETYSKFKGPFRELQFGFKPSEISTFVPSYKSPDTVDLFGSFQKTTISPALPKIDFHLVKTYLTDLPYVSDLITLDEQTAWISNLDKRVLQKINIEGDKIRTTKEISQEVFNMTITPKNDILMTCWKEHFDIKLLTKSGEVKFFISLSPLLPLGIHVTSDNVIIVGVTESFEFKTTNRSTRALYIYGEDRKRKKCYEYDRSNKRLFTLPRRINTNINNDIVVIDRTSNITGRVVVIDREGDLKWTYNGHPKINNSIQFHPRDIVTTTLGYIIVSDYRTHALHVLSENGDRLSCQVMEDIGITYPRSLDIDRRGLLRVGCQTGGKDTGAEIHIVKLQ